MDQEQTDLDIVIVVVEEFSPVRHHIRATAGENHMDHVARERGQLKIIFWYNMIISYTTAILSNQFKYPKNSWPLCCLVSSLGVAAAIKRLPQNDERALSGRRKALIGICKGGIRSTYVVTHKYRSS